MKLHIISVSELWRHPQVLYLLEDFRARDIAQWETFICLARASPGLHCQQWGKYIIFISSLQAALNFVSWFLGHLLPSVLKSEFFMIILDPAIAKAYLEYIVVS